jgi:hypothetical protein
VSYLVKKYHGFFNSALMGEDLAEVVAKERALKKM